MIISNYKDDEYVKVKLTKPIVLPNGNEIKYLEIVQPVDIKMIDLERRGIVLDEVGGQKFIMTILEITARNGETGADLPAKFMEQITIGHVNDVGKVINTEEEVQDPKE